MLRSPSKLRNTYARLRTLDVAVASESSDQRRRQHHGADQDRTDRQHLERPATPKRQVSKLLLDQLAFEAVGELPIAMLASHLNLLLP